MVQRHQFRAVRHKAQQMRLSGQALFLHLAADGFHVRSIPRSYQFKAHTLALQQRAGLQNAVNILLVIVLPHKQQHRVMPQPDPAVQRGHSLRGQRLPVGAVFHNADLAMVAIFP